MVFSLTYWKCFQMNIMIVLWRLQCDIASCDKKTVSGSCSMSDWQILLIIQCAPCSVWCRLALVAKEVSGRLKHQGEEVAKPLQILCLGVTRYGRNGERDCDKVPWALPQCLGWHRDGGPSAAPWRGSSPGLEWLVRGGNGARLVACSHTSHFSSVIRLH